MTPEPISGFGPVCGIDCPYSGGDPPVLNAAKFHKPLMKLATQKLKLKRPTTHRKKHHHRSQYY